MPSFDELVTKIHELVFRFSRHTGSDHIEESEKWLTSFLQLAAGIEPELGERIVAENAVLWEQHALLSQLYSRYLQTQEFQAARKLVREVAQGRHFKLKAGGEFAERAYARVRDMFEHCDFSRCRRFVMAGCGPLPVTMFQVLDHTNVPAVVGIDCDLRAVGAAQELFQTRGDLRASVVHGDGQDYDYADANVIYIANMCSPKAAILDAVGRTVSKEAQIIAREPVSLGRLLAENVENSLNDNWRVVGEGEKDRRFLSRHLFLQRIKH